MKLLVRNLARTTPEKDILALFKVHGSVEYCTLVMDPETGQSKGFGFVEMPNFAEAKRAIAALNGRMVDQSKIRVKESEEA